MVQPKNFWYVASPYSAVGLTGQLARELMEDRFRSVRAFMGWAMRANMIVYSPIVQCHQIATIYNLPTDHEFWLKFDEAMIKGGGGVIVLCIDGWQESFGVRGEVALAHSSGFPVLYAIRDLQETYVLRNDPPR